MKPEDRTDLYTGTGETLEQRGRTFPGHDPVTGDEDPAGYIAPPGLVDAVNVALALGQPLLVTGEPGTGKTCLARSVARELGVECLEFHTKTTSAASDLFYHYDALRRFQDAQVLKGDAAPKPVAEYVTAKALGIAIILADPTETGRAILPSEHRDAAGPKRSVVLIDEIDKAPRDLPNDVLDEIETMRFRVKEAPEWPPFEAAQAFRPVLVLTSNSEKNLPDAFLRRCVFYHIAFADVDLKGIVARRFKRADGKSPLFEPAFVRAAVDRFEAVRELRLKKRPATAEFLAWIGMLKAWQVDLAAEVMDDAARTALLTSASVLAKTREDLEEIRRALAQFPAAKG